MKPLMTRRKQSTLSIGKSCHIHKWADAILIAAALCWLRLAPNARS